MTKEIENKEIGLGLFVSELVKKFQGKEYNEEIICKATTGQNETTAADGGYLVNYDIVREIIASAQQGSVLYNKTKKIPSPKYGLSVPFVYEADRLNDTATGIRGYFVGEGEQKTVSSAKFRSRNLKLQKLVIRIPATWEIMEDVDALDGFLTSFASEKLSWYIDYAIIYGTDRVEGIFSTNAQGVTEATSADPLTLTVLQNFEKKIAPSSWKNAEWYLSKENWNDIVDLVDDTNTNTWLSYSGGDAYIFGHKVNVLEQLSGDEGIILGDFTQYLVTEVEMKKKISITLKWDYNEEELLMEVRFTGASFGSVHTLDDGSEVAPFVVAEGTTPVLSSSSSSSSSVDSSSSSTSSSASTSSSSRDSSSSSSSEQYSSHSSQSSESSEQYSSESSESSGSTGGVSSSSESSSSFDGFSTKYYGSGFTTTELNDDWEYMGSEYNGAPVFENMSSTYVMWKDATGYWAISNDIGDPENQWVSSTDTAVSKPDADIWVDEDGTITAGSAYSSSSSSSSN